MHRGAAGYQAAYAVYPAENYGIGSKPAPPPKAAAADAAQDDGGSNPNAAQAAAAGRGGGGGLSGGAPEAAKAARRKRRYAQEGLRRTAEALLLVARHGHPHVLLAQYGPGHFALPGGRVRPGEDDVDALKRKLAKQLSPEDATLAHAWEIGEVVGCWWRTGFDSALFPYVPAHCARPKESVRLFFVALPESGFFGVPRDRRLVAVPLFELHDNPGRYGPLLAAVPAMLSRFRLNVIAGTGTVGIGGGGVAGAAGGGVAAGGGGSTGGGGTGGGAPEYDPYL